MSRTSQIFLLSLAAALSLAAVWRVATSIAAGEPTKLGLLLVAVAVLCLLALACGKEPGYDQDDSE